VFKTLAEQYGCAVNTAFAFGYATAFGGGQGNIFRSPCFGYLILADFKRRYSSAMLSCPGTFATFFVEMRYQHT
jgi:hypothetical protein